MSEAHRPPLVVRLSATVCLLGVVLMAGCGDSRSDELNEEAKELRVEKDLLESQLALKMQREAQLTQAERAEAAQMGLRLKEVKDRLDGIALELQKLNSSIDTDVTD